MKGRAVHCPECGSEYVDGVDACADCGVPLVDAPAAQPIPAAQNPVVVFSSGHADMIAIAKSILESEKIPYGVASEEVQDLFGLGRFPSGTSVIAGPVRVFVPAELAIDARAALIDLQASADTSVTESEEAAQQQSSWRRFVVTSAKWLALIWLAVSAGTMLQPVIENMFGG